MITATSAFSTALSNFWRGQYTPGSGPSLPIVITIQGYSRVFTNYNSHVSGQYDWLVTESLGDISTMIHDLEGGADQVSFSFNVQDRGAAITGDFPGFIFEGKQITLQVGLPGLAQADFITLFTGFVDTVASDNNNTEYSFNCSDISSRLTQVVYLNGDSGQPISSSNPKTLLAHPLDLLISVLGQTGLNLIPDFDGNLGQWIMSSAGSMTYSATGGQRSGGKWVYIGTGAASSFLFPRSKTFNVTPGQTYTLSGFIDATNVTAAPGIGPFVAVYDPTFSIQYVSVGRTSGSGLLSVNWTVPVGVTQVIVLFDTNNCTVSNGNPLVFSDPQLAVANVGTSFLIDVNKIRSYRDGVFNGTQFSFRLTSSLAAADFVKQQILKPLGGYLWVNALGVLTVNFFYPLASPAAVATLGPDSWTSVPTAEQVGSSATEMINQVQFQFDKDDSSSSSSGNYLASDTEIYSASANKYAQYGEQVIQADGLRSGFQGFFTARMVARMIFGRYGLKSLIFDQNASDSVWQTVRLEPGDIVAVTHNQIPDRAAGVMGITSKLFEVINKKVNLVEGLLTYTMIDAAYLQTFGLFKISPDGQADYTAGANTYMYLCNDTDQYTNGDAAHTLG